MASAKQLASWIASSLDQKGVIMHSPVRTAQPCCSLTTLKVIMASLHKRSEMKSDKSTRGLISAERTDSDIAWPRTNRMPGTTCELPKETPKWIYNLPLQMTMGRLPEVALR
jgi:hypothetical protein